MSSLPDNTGNSGNIVAPTTKTPPKRVPVLTRVAQWPEGHPSGPAPLGPSTAPSPLTRSPSTSPAPLTAADPSFATPSARLAALHPADPYSLGQRVLQRVDVLLERRIRDAVTAIAIEHARAIADDMRPVIEAAVREAVNEALALEADHWSAAPPTSPH